MATQIGSYDFRASNQARQSIEVGGRNLLSSTYRSHSASAYDAYTLRFNDPLEIGQTYTVQLWDVDVSHTGKTESTLGISVYIGGGSANTGIDWFGTEYFTNGHADHLVGHFVYTQSMHDRSGGTNKWLVLYNSVSFVDGTKSMSVGKWQMEKGNIATDWKQSDDDIMAELFSIRDERVYVEQTNTGSDTWTGNAPTLTSLEDGQQIDFWHTSNWVGSGYVNTTNYSSQNGCALNLTLADGTTTGAIPIWFSGTGRLTSHYQAGTLIQMVYKENFLYPGYAETHRVARGWYCKANYDSNNHDTISSVNATAGANGVFAYSLVAQDTDTTWTSFTTSGGAGTSKTYSSVAVDPSKIWYFYNGNNRASGVTTGGNYYSDYYYVDMRYTLNISTSAFTARENVYFKGTLQEDGKFKLYASSPWTQTEPTTEDGYYYWLIGVAYDGYRICLSNSHPVYVYKYGAFQEVSGLAVRDTHRIYYRTGAVNSNLTAPTTWVAEATGNVYNAWTTKVPPIKAKNGAASTDEDGSKYLYLYTCEQSRLANGKIVSTKVLLDENTTVIDGGSIITNSVAANKLTVYDATIDKIKSEYINVGAIDITSTANFDAVNDQIIDLQDDIDATNETYSHLIREVNGTVETALTNSNGEYVGYRTVQSANGTDIYEPNSSASIAHYGAQSRIGRQDDMHLDLSSGRLAFADANGTEVAYMAVVDGQSVFKIEHSIVVQDLKFGDWKWWNRPNNNMTLKWTGEDL